KYLPTVDAKTHQRMSDHLSDRKRLATVALDVARQEPREAILCVVGGLLLRIHDDEPLPVGERRPARTMVVVNGGLGAAMQSDHQARHARQSDGNISKHPKIAGICTERGQLLQPRRCSSELPTPPTGRIGASGNEKALELATQMLQLS